MCLLFACETQSDVTRSVHPNVCDWNSSLLLFSHEERERVRDKEAWSDWETHKAYIPRRISSESQHKSSRDGGDGPDREVSQQ